MWDMIMSVTFLERQIRDRTFVLVKNFVQEISRNAIFLWGPNKQLPKLKLLNFANAIICSSHNAPYYCKVLSRYTACHISKCLELKIGLAAPFWCTRTLLKGFCLFLYPDFVMVIWKSPPELVQKGKMQFIFYPWLNSFRSIVLIINYL